MKVSSLQFVATLPAEQKNVRRESTLTRLRTSHHSVQEDTLLKLVEQAKNTEFGILHGFQRVLESDTPLQTFKRSVPLTDYDLFYEQWIQRALEYVSDLIWPGRIKHFALSSGTTKGASKFIPVSHQMLRQFKKTSLKQVSQLSLTLPRGKMLTTKALIIGGSTTLKYRGNVKTGDLSGILAKNKSWLYTSVSKPGKKINQMADWEEKMDQIVAKAPSWNIGVIAGVPSWVALLLERIVQHHQVETIHDIWPNLQLYVHGGIFIKPYKEKIDKLCRKPLLLQNTYLASEGYFGYQKKLDSSAMTLLEKHGVFYEFVDASQFEALRLKRFDEIQTISSDEVVPNVSYAMVVSTCSGLWRYSLGDLIQFEDVKLKTFKIIGRLSYHLNLAGEHLSEEQLSTALSDVSAEFGIEINEFCVHPNEDLGQHQWYVGITQSVSESAFGKALDERLQELNDDYRTARKFLIKPPKVTALPVDKFYLFMRLNDRIGAQCKFPRVMNALLMKDWLAFLSNHKSCLNNTSTNE